MSKVKIKTNKRVLADIKDQIKDAVILVGKDGLSKVKERLSKKGLSPEQLASLDHPYAKRHGKIQASNSAPDQYVGRQTGAIRKSLKGKGSGAGTNQYALRYTYSIGFVKPPKHATFVFNGTRVMLPRNPLAVLEDEQIEKEMVAKFVKSVKI